MDSERRHDPNQDILIIAFSITLSWIPVFIALKIIQECKRCLRERRERREPEPDPEKEIDRIGSVVDRESTETEPDRTSNEPHSDPEGNVTQQSGQSETVTSSQWQSIPEDTASPDRGESSKQAQKQPSTGISDRSDLDVAGSEGGSGRNSRLEVVEEAMEREGHRTDGS